MVQEDYEIMTAIDLKKHLGTTIRAQRSSLGISQEELAYRSGLHRTYISDLERGARNPSIETVGKLASALDMSVSKLFDRGANGNGERQAVQIVLVEDNPNDVELTMRAFAKANITNPVKVLRDGQEALDFFFAGESLSKRGSQIILLDLNLPKKSGIEVLEKLKANKQTRHIPVIVLTVSNQDRDIVQCRRLGCEDYIVKPVGFQKFSNIIPHIRLGWTLVDSRL
jgi:CheY-like chemotaxis protein/DNA-binding transcriptional regulator YiaG